MIMRKTYKVIYTVPNQQGQKVTFVQAFNEIEARHIAYREFGGHDSFSANIVIWEVKEI